jgi:hypothetical protein
MAVSRFSNSTIANGFPKYQKIWDQTTRLGISSADLMVVAGGGGGGYDEGGGAGAGGFRLLTSQTFVGGVTYTVTVGNGGAGRTEAYSTVGNPGGNSSFIGTGLSISASGGGSGTSGYGGKTAAGGSGGGYRGSNIAGNVGGYTPVEGYQGGATGSRAAAGGGGAGGAGPDWTSGDSRGATGGIGAGGTSYTNYAIINAMGSATTAGQLDSGNYYFAGGGAGGAIGQFGQGGGYGGLGGGGRGSGSDTGAAGAGTVNTGGGGGAASGWGGSAIGGAGGSGIVIIRYPDSFGTAASTTGSPTLVTTGGYRYYKFTGNGSITF